MTDFIDNLSITTYLSSCFSLYNQLVAISIEHIFTGMLVALYHIRHCRTGCCHCDVVIWRIRNDIIRIHGKSLKVFKNIQVRNIR